MGSPENLRKSKQSGLEDIDSGRNESYHQEACSVTCVPIKFIFGQYYRIGGHSSIEK